jgi:hypothetical protein
MPPSREPPPRKPSEYEKFVSRRWDGLAQAGTVFYIRAAHIAGHCPACRKGTVSALFLTKAGEPRVRYVHWNSDGWVNGCSLGCTPNTIARAMP